MRDRLASQPKRFCPFLNALNSLGNSLESQSIQTVQENRIQPANRCSGSEGFEAFHRRGDMAGAHLLEELCQAATLFGPRKLV